MNILSTIILVVAICAVIGIIVSAFGIAGYGPARSAHGAPFNLEPVVWLAVSLAVLVVDGLVWALATLWTDPAYRPIALILGLGFVLLGAAAAWRVGLARSLWRAVLQLAPRRAGEVKKPWLSKTIALNALVGIGLLAEANVASLQGLLPPSKYQIVAFTLPILNMLLRAYTTKGLSLKQAAPQDGSAG